MVLGISRRPSGLLISVVWALTYAVRSSAAEPTLTNINVRGLQIEGSTTLTIDGEEFGKTPRLVLPFAAKVQHKPGANPKQAIFDVQLGPDVIPGYYHLRVVSEAGVTLPTVIAVDKLVQKPMVPEISTLPIALHGVVNTSAGLETKLTGKAGQKVTIEVESHRLGGKLRPVLHLYNAKRLQVAWSWPISRLHGDTRLEAVLPEDGIYSVTLHDIEYAPPAGSFFRLRVGQWSYVDHVFPPMIGKGNAKGVELLIGTSVVPTSVLSSTTPGIATLPWPKDGVWSGPRPFVEILPSAEFLKQPPSPKGQDLPAGVVGVSGRFAQPFDEDRYRIPVKAGDKVRLEVFADRLGSTLDTALVVRNDAGAELARADEQPGTIDPKLEYKVPEKVDFLVVGVIDSQGRASPRGFYRLEIDPRPTPPASFQVSATSSRATLPIGGRTVIPVIAKRQGYLGKIELSAPGLPRGVKVEGTTIPAEADGTLVTFQRGEMGPDPVLVTWRAKSESGDDQPITIKGHSLEKIQPWLAQEFVLATNNVKAADFQIDWRSLANDAPLVPGMKLTLPIRLSRIDANTIAKLTLLTSQSPPIVNNQPDVNKTVRAEKPVEIPVKTADGEMVVIVPADLSSLLVDVTVQAEFTTADKKTVLASAFTPVRRMAVRLPIVVAVEGPSKLEATLNPKTGTEFALKGKVDRRGGFKGDVEVTLAGLPAGVKTEKIPVKADKSEFQAKITFPPNLAANEYKGIKLIASVTPDPKQPAVVVRSKEVELTLVVKPAPAEPKKESKK